MQFDTRSLWIYLYFPQLQLDLLQSSNEQALGIVDTSNNQLCQLNQKALKSGVKLGMGLASASLVYPDLCLHEYNQDVESNAITNRANKLYLFTSDIVLMPPQAIVLRAQNMLSLYGGLQDYWQVIQQCLEQYLSEQHLKYIASSAYSVQGAKVLALSGQQLISQERKIIQEKLLRCSLSVSDIDPKDLDKLMRIGVKTYADLAQLALPEVANRVSRFSMSVINELAGKQAARLKFYQPTPSYHDYLELLYEVSNSDKLLPIIHRCINKLSEFLLLRNAHCLSISTTFFQRDHAPIEQIFNSIRPIYKACDWLDIISLQIESMLFSSPVYALSIHCSQYEVASIANDDMFANKSSHVAALTLLSRLQSKLGKVNVKRLHFVADFRPESSSLQTSINQDNAVNKASSKNSQIFADRPGLLLPQPLPLRMQVEVIKGPERIQTGWWDDKPINRDYYIGQSPNGQQVWIFKTPNKQWYLHGYFI